MVVGTVTWVGGPVIRAKAMETAKISEVVEVGDDHLLGEVVAVEGGIASIQIYESTTGLKPGTAVVGTGEPFSATLGPGLLGTIYDGVQRPLERLAQKSGDYIASGLKIPSLPRTSWRFIPHAKTGEVLAQGQRIGTIQETPLIEHRILTPPHVEGTLEEIEPEGDYRLDEVVATIRQGDERYPVTLCQKWPVRVPRPYLEKVESRQPLITGVRIIDTFFPVEKGGTVCVPGGFGTGKTVLLHTIAAWANADVVVYIGCGERGNEMTDVLQKFPQYKDPKTKRPLMERTILIANTSNMPVSAREASIYIGATIAEYYRDMGYDTLLVADSTSRWAEALREISARLGEMPADRGYPSYLSSRIASFYERAGTVQVIPHGTTGSLTICGAVSPPEGDYTEPITAHTRRFTNVFWALDAALAYSRQYPAINWMNSYSPVITKLKEWWNTNIARDWHDYYETASTLLQREDELQKIVRLLGAESLPDLEKLTLTISRFLKDGFLHQNAYDPIDVYTAPQTQYAMLKTILEFYAHAKDAIEANVPLQKVAGLPITETLSNIRSRVSELDDVEAQMRSQFQGLTTSE
jgi:V/A-type H+-transporting ATPase subunit A